MKSKREDARGHWPAGKRRNEDKGDWSRIRLSLTTFLNQHYRPGEISARALADATGYSDRSVRRWIAGEDRPPVEVQEAIEAWMSEWREKLKQRRAR